MIDVSSVQNPTLANFGHYLKLKKINKPFLIPLQQWLQQQDFVRVDAYGRLALTAPESRPAKRRKPN